MADRPSGGPFDRVELTLDDGKSRTMTPREFEEMKLDERVRALLRKRLRFFSGDAEIPVRRALSNQ